MISFSVSSFPRVLILLAVTVDFANSFAIGGRRNKCCHISRRRYSRNPRQFGVHGSQYHHDPTSLQSSSSSSSSSEDQVGEFDYFQQGSPEVFHAFRRLKNSINLFDADFNLQQAERRETLQTMARQRYSIAEFAQNTLVGPLVLSSVAAVLYKVLPMSVSRFYRKLSALHFWIAIVLAPLYLRLRMSLEKGSIKNGEENDETRRQQLADLGPRRAFAGQNREDPNKSCSDHVLCLTEQWCSAVVGVMCFGAAISQAARVPVCIAMRVAAFLSLHQFPKLWFEFERKSQPRPLTRWASLLTSLVNVIATRWFVALDTAQWLSMQSWRTVASVYGTLWLGTLLTARQWPPPRSHSESTGRNLPNKSRQRLRWFTGSCIVACFVLAKGTSAIPDTWIQTSSTAAIARQILRLTAAGLALVGPMGHMIGFFRNIKVLYTHDLPLTLRPEEFSKSAERSSIYQWRFRLNWREPKRVKIVLDELSHGLFYSLFVSGNVEEQWRRQKRSGEQDELKKRGFHLLQRVEHDMKYSSGNPYARINILSKNEAMEIVKERHNKAFERGRMDDSIGQALSKVFDIGLGFEFQEEGLNRTLGDNPTSRQLQVKAATTAIARAQQLYSKTAEEELLQGITDPVDREGKVKELREKRENEMLYMKQQLTELVPSDFSTGKNRTFQGEQFSALLGHEPRDPVIEALLKEGRQILEGRVEIDYLNPSGDDHSNGSGENKTAVQNFDPPRRSNATATSANDTYVDLRDPLAFNASNGFNDVQLC